MPCIFVPALVSFPRWWIQAMYRRQRNCVITCATPSTWTSQFCFTSCPIPWASNSWWRHYRYGVVLKCKWLFYLLLIDVQNVLIYICFIFIIEDVWFPRHQHEFGCGAVPGHVPADHGHHLPPSLHQPQWQQRLVKRLPVHPGVHRLLTAAYRQDHQHWHSAVSPFTSSLAKCPIRSLSSTPWRI